MDVEIENMQAVGGRNDADDKKKWKRLISKWNG